MAERRGEGVTVRHVEDAPRFEVGGDRLDGTVLVEGAVQHGDGLAVEAKRDTGLPVAGINRPTTPRSNQNICLRRQSIHDLIHILLIILLDTPPVLETIIREAQ